MLEFKDIYSLSMTILEFEYTMITKIEFNKYTIEKSKN